MIKKRKVRGPKRKDNEKMLLVKCPWCGEMTGEVRLTHKGKHPYIRCLRCQTKSDGASSACANYVLNHLKRGEREALGDWDWKSAEKKLSWYVTDYEARRAAKIKKVETARENGTVTYSAIWALMNCPLCKEHKAVLRLTLRKQRPYITCYSCFGRGMGTLGVYAYVTQKRSSSVELQLSDNITKKMFSDMLEYNVSCKVAKLREADEKKKSKG